MRTSSSMLLPVFLATGMAGLLSASSWTIATVDVGTGPGGVGFYGGLALDPVTGGPTLAYSDNDRDDVKCARLVDGVWQRSIVDAGKNVSTGIDLAYDEAGRPGISYGWGALKLAEWDGSRWNVQTVVKSQAYNDVTSLAYHPGEPWISYRANAGKSTRLMLARRIGNIWAHTTIDTAGAGKYSALAVDATGNAAVAYAADPDGDGTPNALRLARLGAGQWSIEQIESGTGAGVHVDLAFDPSTGEPAIVHGTSGGGVQVRFWYRRGGQWLGESVDTGALTSLTFDAFGTPVISYSGDSYTSVKTARRNGGVWTTETVATVSGSVASTGLVFAPGSTAPIVSFAVATTGTGGTRSLKVGIPAS